MDASRQLFMEFRESFNADLIMLGCRLRVAMDDPGLERAFLLLAADGSPLGWVPDHVDALIVSAFEKILMTRGEPPSPAQPLG